MWPWENAAECVFAEILPFFDKPILIGLYYHNVLCGELDFFLFPINVQLYVCQINLFCERLVTRYGAMWTWEYVAVLHLPTAVCSKPGTQKNWETRSASTALGCIYRIWNKCVSCLDRLEMSWHKAILSFKCHILCYDLTLPHFTNFNEVYSTGLEATERNHCYMFTIRSSVRV